MKLEAVNDIVSPPQMKIFINCVMKGQNQAIGMILHLTIWKNLPKEKKEGDVESNPEGGVFQLQGGADCSHQRRGVPPPSYILEG